MHEMGLCDAIVEAAVRRAGRHPVSSVRVRITGHPVDAGVLEQGLRLAAAGTVVEGATVEVIARPPSVRCRDCGTRFEAVDPRLLAACPRCGGVDVDASGAEEVVLEAIAFDPVQERSS
ncbi:hydrogenase maturation nickel metallochaperone HypA/HybF [Actinoallomurus rhizosphaericola]|uniref:hydrogenase maturation nickel metallochaperone HypA/HybF n=1 Tax=Actinoallomurus rhizosphaericola TaxID=2952536 RepID=UPI002091D65F|nr:hydrogenase maturation nickel metallochaperone HypA [Actinoallomurus rhizosphaericola]MCO5992972.1 hydrogenase maturation nickel metallochaperone HypA [Actinoallomurus rhizosphaericola]